MIISLTSETIPKNYIEWGLYDRSHYGDYGDNEIVKSFYIQNELDYTPDYTSMEYHG